MRLILISVLLATLCGCVTSGGANSPESTRADTFMIQCFKQQAFALDDHKSDVRSIANAVVSSCNSEIMNVIRAGAGSLTYDGYLRFERGVKNGSVGIAEQVVLLERQGQ